MMMNSAHGKTITVLGVDPALRNFGYAIAEVDLEKNEIVSVNDLILVKTTDERVKGSKRNTDDLGRAKKLSQSFMDLSSKTHVSFCEVPIGSQSARAMASYGICIGVLSCCKNHFVQVTPTEVKVCATGIKTATKEEMIEWANGKYPNAPWLVVKRKGKMVLKNENEHLADAIGAINAGLQTNAWNSLRKELVQSFKQVNN